MDIVQFFGLPTADMVVPILADKDVCMHAGCLGITLSFHRQISHRSFTTPKWLEYALAYCGVLGCPGKEAPHKRKNCHYNFMPYTAVLKRCM